MSIDSFLAELFPSAPLDTGGGASRLGGGGFPLPPGPRAQPDELGPGGFPRPPAMFDERFQPAMDKPLEDISLQTGAAPMSGRGPSMNVPMPQPRPNIEAILEGNGGGGAPAMAPPSAAPAPDGGGGGMDAFARLLGPFAGRGPVTTGRGATSDEPGNGILTGALGMNASQEKRLLSSIAGGFAGGNPNFKGGAFMKGMGGGLKAGLASDKEDREAETTSADKDQKQSNFERVQGDKEQTNDALRKLYGERGKALTTNAATRANTPGKTAWNKPPHERLKDVERLIIDKEKQLKNGINPLAPKAERDAAKAQADKELGAFKQRVYKQYGFDQNGDELPNGGGTPSSGKVIGDQEAKDSGLYAKGTYDDPAMPTSQDEFNALPAGTVFINPKDGALMTKRGAQP